MEPLKRYAFTPILGWSVTRYDLFQTCKRRYFYTYYAKHDREYSRDRIELLKKLTSIPLEIGNIVHDVFKVFLERMRKTEAPIDKAAFFDYVKRKTHAYCDGKTFCEIYYGDLSDINKDEIYAKVRGCLIGFLDSRRFNWITEEAISQKNQWIIEPPGYGETRIDDMKAYCKVDFLFPLNDEIYIIDWKTGKPNEQKHRKQLIGYATWASNQFDHAPEKIIPIIANLWPEYVETTFKLNQFDIQELALRIKEESRDMYAYCADVEQNIPRGKDAFSKTTISKICNYCNFRELCFD
jgi:hypothetical protein